ncbi:MAG: hypothetical protein IIW96_04515, partial [Oscillibacter sp.]|nr:hypothetical protein [Oscillibacter sp.]
MKEDLLLEKARHGDQEAFGELVRLYEKKVYALTLRMCKNPDDAAEAAQEAFGNCTGSKSLTFTIEKATPLIQTAPTASKIHVGTALASSDLIGGMAVSDNSISMKGTFSWKDGSIVPTLEDSGVTKYTVVFTPEDSNHYTTAEVDITVLVDPKPLAGIDVSLNNGSVYIYTGKEIKPVVLVKFENTLLEEGKDYQVSYENNINVATMATENAPTVVVEGIGDYSGSKSLKFTIEKATPLIQTVPTASKIQEGDALSSSTLSGGVALNGIPMNGNDVSGNHLNFVDGTFRWKDGTIIPTVADSGVTKYAVVFTPDDTDNYNTFEFGITVIVEKKSSTDQPSSSNTGTQKPGSGDSGSGNSDTQNSGSGDSGTDKPATQ